VTQDGGTASSVNLDSCVDLADEGVCGVESNSAGEQPEREHH